MFLSPSSSWLVELPISLSFTSQPSSEIIEILASRILSWTFRHRSFCFTKCFLCAQRWPVFAPLAAAPGCQTSHFFQTTQWSVNWDRQMMVNEGYFGFCVANTCQLATFIASRFIIFCFNRSSNNIFVQHAKLLWTLSSWQAFAQEKTRRCDNRWVYQTIPCSCEMFKIPTAVLVLEGKAVRSTLYCIYSFGCETLQSLIQA